MRRLESHHFPGNVRELENIIERAVTLCGESHLGAADLPPLRQRPQVAGDPATVAIPEDGLDLEAVLTDYERAIVQRALEQSGGVRKRAAALLGISFRSLRYRLKKLGLDDGV
jgi:two-component system response regulator PilR (NtrC family)